MADINSMISKIESNTEHSDTLRDNLVAKLREAKFSLDDFYNEEFANLKDENGELVDPSTMTNEEKHKYLKAVNAVDDVDANEENPTFQKRYDDRENKVKDFMRATVNILELKVLLIEKNAEELNNLKKEGIGKNNIDIAKLREDLEKNRQENENEKQKINELRQEIQEILAARAIDVDQFKSVKEEIKVLKEEYSKVEQDFADKQAEYAAESDPDKKQKLYEELEVLSKEKSSKQMEIDSKESMQKDAKYNIDKSFGIKDEKNKELRELEANTIKLNEDNLKINEDIQQIQSKNAAFAVDIKRLEEANEKFSDSLINDFDIFNKEFANKGIDITFGRNMRRKISVENFDMEENGVRNQSDSNSKQNSDNDNSNSKNNEQTQNNGQVQNNEQTQNSNNQNNIQQSSNMPIPDELAELIDDPTKAMKRFKSLSFEKQKYLLDNLSNEELLNAIDGMGIFAKRGLASALQEHLNESMPKSVDFKEALAKVAPTYSMSLNSLCDKKGNLLPLNKLDLDQLDDIQGIFNEFNKSKSLLSPEEVESFEKNFMSPIRNNEILQKAKTGKIKELFNRNKNIEKTEAGKNVVNNISDYYTEKKEKLSNKKGSNSKFKDVLKDGVEEYPQETRRSRSKPSQSRDIDQRS